MKHCINCGEQIDDEAEVCTNCGVNQQTSLESGHEDRGENEKYCINCGELINKQAEVCPDCGVQQPSLGGTDSEKVAAGVLALLLGGLGAHKFYQGNVKLGVIYLCFFWTGIPALLGLIEGILILVADDAEYEAKYADGSLLGR
ncbi:TM2 domain-containing protein [Natrinema longum]|uniref:TM2 domain-containing protein n=1 Tax=Natrinema longum TaxID=370324 RepID=A0A8A2U8S3_9EURY|nr:TM2 domain-containing protein [Natrinema longum]MBZ6493543.1 TM2 domain-containing protein [Natrinema longum]QSW85111.1 TM2 domain-containing protein [Natrinema longum]